MSRRTRIKTKREGSSLGKNHHNNYSNAATHFPETYSLFGDEILMPTRILPLCENGKINWVGGEGEFGGHECTLVNLSNNELEGSTSANITIEGSIIQESNKVLTRCIFVCSLAFICLLAIFDSPIFRKYFFTRYTMQTQTYNKLAAVLRQLGKCEHIILNIQDNELDQEKLAIISEALSEACSGVARRKVTIRNYCYYMKDFDLKGALGRLGGMDNVESVFVWQGIIVKGGGTGEGGENEGLLASIGC